MRNVESAQVTIPGERLLGAEYAPVVQALDDTNRLHGDPLELGDRSLFEVLAAGGRLTVERLTAEVHRTGEWRVLRVRLEDTPHLHLAENDLPVAVQRSLDELIAARAAALPPASHDLGEISLRGAEAHLPGVQLTNLSERQVEKLFGLIGLALVRSGGSTWVRRVETDIELPRYEVTLFSPERSGSISITVDEYECDTAPFEQALLRGGPSPSVEGYISRFGEVNGEPVLTTEVTSRSFAVVVYVPTTAGGITLHLEGVRPKSWDDLPEERSSFSRGVEPDEAAEFPGFGPITPMARYLLGAKAEDLIGHLEELRAQFSEGESPRIFSDRSASTFDSLSRLFG